jgi:hypothetical protein
MTDRERLNRRSGWVMIPFSAGVLLFATGVVVSQAGWSPALAAIGIPGFALAFVASIVGRAIAFRCSICGGNLAPLAFAHPSWRFNQRVRFCPFCASDLDSELQGETTLVGAKFGDSEDLGGAK